MNRLAMAAIAALAVTIGGVLVFNEQPAFAATITVDSLDDTIANDGECTLREAIENANDTTDGQPHDDCAAGNPAGEDLIVFSVTGTIVLTGGELPQVDENLVIDGGGDIEIDAASSSSILALGPATLTVQGLTLRNGQTEDAGAAILVDGGDLTVIASSFIANNAIGGGAIDEAGSGGAIAVFSGSLVIEGSIFAENGAEADGGAIYSQGPVDIQDTVFEDNGAFGNGGAIWMNSPEAADLLVLTDVTFVSNRAEFDGGAVHTSNDTSLDMVEAEDNEAGERGGALYIAGRDLELVDSVFVTNAALDGGAIYIDEGTAELHNSLFEENFAEENGGAIYISDAAVDLSGSVFQSNTAEVDGGAIFSNGALVVLVTEFDGNEALGNGGALAIFNRAAAGVELQVEDSTLHENTAENGGAMFLGLGAEVEISRSTLSANEAVDHGGAIYNEATVSIWNSTVSGNTAGEEGGGLLNDGEAEVRNSTFYANTADDGGALRTLEDSDTEITNSVLAGSVEVDNCSLEEDLTGVNGSNISDDDSCGEPLFVEVDDVEVGALADNGGPTRTHLPVSDSPLVDAGHSPSCPDVDQRGEDRPVGEGCDVGSVEVQDPTAPTPTPEPLGDIFVPQIARDVEH